MKRTPINARPFPFIPPYCFVSFLSWASSLLHRGHLQILSWAYGLLQTHLQRKSSKILLRAAKRIETCWSPNQNSLSMSIIFAMSVKPPDIAKSLHFQIKFNFLFLLNIFWFLQTQSWDVMTLCSPSTRDSKMLCNKWPNCVKGWLPECQADWFYGNKYGFHEISQMSLHCIRSMNHGRYNLLIIFKLTFCREHLDRAIKVYVLAVH